MSAEQLIARKVYGALTRFDLKPYRRMMGDVYVSEIVSCIRRAALNMFFNADPVLDDPRAVRGKLLHAALPKALVDEFCGATFEVPCSYPVSDEVTLRGRADMVAGDTVYEFKFTSPYSEATQLYFAQAKGVWGDSAVGWFLTALPPAPMVWGRAANPRTSANAYAVMLEAKLFYVVIVDVDRQHVDVRVLSSEPDLQAFEALCERAKVAFDAAFNRRDPLSAPGADFPWLCQRCPWSVVCSRVEEVAGRAGEGEGQG